MPRNTICDHPNCEGLPCRALTDDELTPREEDDALARKLVSEGWIQVSAKYRMIRRWKNPPPPPEDLVNPAWHDTFFGRRAINILRHIGDENALRCAPDDMVEKRELSIREFKAYKNIKNAEWRALLRDTYGK